VNRRRDQDTDHRLRTAGWTVLRFWEHVDPAMAAQCIAEALRE
jgi:DNA mismatch endonuclease (patch repair protein)